jgi:thioredoxin-like negative regulator of GroEL
VTALAADLLKEINVEITLQRIERSYIKLSLGILFGFLLLIFLCWGGWHFFQGWQAQRLTRRAAAYLNIGDFKSAILTGRHAFQLNPERAAAARVVAEAAERSGDRAALDWWRKALELDPGSSEDALAVVRCALQMGDMATAEHTLSQFGKNAEQTAAYHAATAQFAQANKNMAEAAQHWTKAVELAPNDKSYQLQLAVCRLASPDVAGQQSARATLETLRRDEKWGAAAIRALILNGVARHQAAEQLRDLSKELQSLPGALFADRMLYLEILRELRDPEFTENLTKIEKEAPSRAPELATLLSWMNKNQMSLLAIDFVKGLPNELANKWPVPVVLADSYARLSDWAALERRTEQGSWGDFDFMRHACLARAWRGLGKEVAAQAEWNAAAREAGLQSDRLSSLAQTVSDWGWNAEAIELLWTLTKFAEKKTDALRNLYLRYAAANDTQGLYRVLLRLSESDVSDPDTKNNLAQISLLLNAEPAHGRKLAEEVYRQDSSNPLYVTTYAYALYSKGDLSGAIKAMQDLTEGQLQQPAVSAYYGIFLAGSGDVEKARYYLEGGEKARLLPEEKALLDQAKRRLQSHAATPSRR